MSSCLVTGAAGFIGFHVCEALLAQGHYVLGVDSLNEFYDVQLKRDRLARLRKYVRFLFLQLDLGDRAGVAALFGDTHFDTVYHFAVQAGAGYSIENPYALLDNSLVAFVNVLDGCRRNQPQHLIYASSSAVYGARTKVPFAVDASIDRPVSLAAAAYRSNELMAYAYSHLHTLPVTGLRFFTVYGPWGRPDMTVYMFTRAMLAGETIDLSAYRKRRRDFTYIDDVVASVLRAADLPCKRTNGAEGHAASRLYNLGNNHAIELSELIAALEECLGVQAKIQDHDALPVEAPEAYADIEASTRDLGFQPRIPLRDGLARFVEWYRDYHCRWESGGAATAVATAT